MANEDFTVRECSAPWWAGGRTQRASVKQGYRYERKVARYLEKAVGTLGWELQDHPWFEVLCGEQCVAHFQPDFLLLAPSGCGLVAEAKLTWVDTTDQCKKYQDYLALAGLPTQPFTIARNLTPETPRDLVVDELVDVKPDAVLHLWL